MISPESILAPKKGYTRKKEADVPLYTGGFCYPWSKNPGIVSMDDISWGLAHTYRYGGQRDPGVTVAEHSVLVHQIICRLWPDCDPLIKRAGLLHDAGESILHDIQSPLRKKIMVEVQGVLIPWEEMEMQVTLRLLKDVGVLQEHLESPEVRAADRLAVSFEVRDSRNLEILGMPDIPSEISDLKVVGYGPEIAWVKFSEVLAKELNL